MRCFSLACEEFAGKSRELQSAGSGPIFGESGSNPSEMVARKLGPDPFALDVAVLLLLPLMHPRTLAPEVDV